MKTLVECLQEHLGYQINENFESEVLRTTFIDNPTNKTEFKRSFARELKWDIIPEEDVEKIDTEAAGKLAYQRKDIPAYILWFDGDDKLLARTISNNDIKCGYRSPWKNVRKVQQAAAYAIVIKDYIRFDTTELKKQRAEAKKGALAFMTEKEILAKNLKRYAEKLEDIKADKFQMGDYVEKVKNVLNKMGDLKDSISEDFVPDNWRTFSTNFFNLSNIAQNIFDTFTDIADDNQAETVETLGRDLKHFDEAFNRFCIMYDVALKGEETKWM